MFLHTGLTEIDNTNLNWGSTSQSLSFRIGYGGKVSVPTGKRDGYKFLGWYTESGSAYASSTILNDSTVTKEYVKSNTPTDPETIDEAGTHWYGPWDVATSGTSNSDADRAWITKRLDLYASWTKVLDGAENNIITYVDLVQYEVAPYYNYTGHLLLPDELIINNDVLASMSEEDQAALRKVCAESMPVCYELCNELRSEYQAKAEAQGVTFSEADIPAFQANCQDQIKEVAERTDITKGVYELIMSLRETA